MKERRKRTLAKLIGDMRTKDFAEQYDLDASYLSQILNGHRGMGEKAARTMEIKIGLPEGTFLHPSVEGVSGEHGDNQGQESNVIAADFTKKPLREGEMRITQYDLRAAMGSGQLPADYLDVLREITIHRSFFESAGVSYTSASQLAVVTGWGQSMEPTINHGDPIFIDCGVTDFVSDGVYLLTWDNLAYIKRVQKVSKTELKIISDNRNHDPFVVNAEDVIFHARAIMVWNGKKL
ncbi:S24 family peptidase [Halopseudomonas aestusnigri]|uniref:S24 family peptidase n=1 Tax=Halopseudomonas aestusnigri TaxID=857252 RepID=UPI0025543024|nr:S24 family peptidase [Halopseudomonas aestusnigri]MDL2200848.1 S24 family peptidase [Halopseudomonas aestusnigri]